MKQLLFSMLLVAALAVPAMADPAGRWAMTGTNPNGSGYGGKVEVVERQGWYDVTYSDNHTSWHGVGIFDPNTGTFSVSYNGTAGWGIAVYHDDGSSLNGNWHMSGLRGVGTESWTR